MPFQRVVAGIALACAMAVAAPQPAFAGLKINLIFVDNAPPASPKIMIGGGQLQEIMQVAAENWERVFKSGNGNWKLTVEYGWAPLVSNLFANERMISEGGNPSRITHTCILFNNNPGLFPPVAGLFADPTPRDNSEYLSYTSNAVNMGDGWLNAGRVFSDPAGDAVDRIDVLQVAIHEIGHALGLDGKYSGFIAQGDTRLVDLTAPRPFAGSAILIANGPHIDGFPHTPLMIERPLSGARQMISGADALLLAQLSSFNRPDLTEPSPEENGNDSRGIAMSTVSSSPTCPTNDATTDTGVW